MRQIEFSFHDNDDFQTVTSSSASSPLLISTNLKKIAILNRNIDQLNEEFKEITYEIISLKAQNFTTDQLVNYLLPLRRERGDIRAQITLDSAELIRISSHVRVSDVAIPRKNILNYLSTDIFISLLKYLPIGSQLKLLRNKSYVFDPLTCGSHIVDEYFTYISREEEAENIVNVMRGRQELRSCSGATVEDKRNNPLIAVPGSPGSGKSTFLSHFPASYAYKKYIATVMKSEESAVVSLITFNNAMGGTSDALGLRIIYGVLVSMGILDCRKVSWQEFLRKHPLLYFMTVTEAVRFLRKIVGPTRPILLVVDELSKSENDRVNMKQLTDVLDLDGKLDIIVSSLSPTYIKKLLPKNNRLIKYMVLESLVDQTLGKKECLSWANWMIDQVGGTAKVDKSVQALLRNIYLLYSGHPRSLEMMAESFLKFDRWLPLVPLIVDNNIPRPALLFKLLRKLPSYNNDILGLTEEQLARYVFSTPAVFTEEDEGLRELLEDGKLSFSKYEPENENDYFITSVSSIALLKWSVYVADPVGNINSRVKAARILLKDFKFCKQTATWWERLVALNIITRSHVRSSMSALLGIKDIENDTASNWKIEVQEQRNHNSNSTSSCYIIPTDANHPGNDGGRLKLYNDNLDVMFHYYLQMKITKLKDPLPDVIASMICHNLLEATMDPNVNLNHTHMILYIWGLDDDDEILLIDQNLVLKQIPGQVKKMILNGTAKSPVPLDFEETVSKYTERYFGHVHVVGASAMDEWISDSISSFPKFFSYIENAELIV